MPRSPISYVIHPHGSSFGPTLEKISPRKPPHSCISRHARAETCCSMIAKPQAFTDTDEGILLLVFDCGSQLT